MLALPQTKPIQRPPIKEVTTLSNNPGKDGWDGFRECQISGDFLLIYNITARGRQSRDALGSQEVNTFCLKVNCLRASVCKAVS